MAILEEYVEVNLNPNNVNHFEVMGYKIPRYFNTRDKKWKIKKGTTILVDIKDLLPQSGVRVTKICDYCGFHIPNQSIQIINTHKDEHGKDSCNKCGNIRRARNRRSSVKYENSVEYFAKNNNMEYLLSEYSNLNIKQPRYVSRSTHDKYWWYCFECHSLYDMAVSDRTGKNKNGCPFCSGRRVNHTNSLASRYPEVSEMLLDKSVGHCVTYGSNKYLDFICDRCGHNLGKRMVNNVVRNGIICPRCSDGVSYPEKFMMSVLDQLGIEYEYNVRFEWSNNKRYDFFIDSLDIIIETHGMQHYKNGFDNVGGRDVQEEVLNDEFKRDVALLNGVRRYIVIDCRYSNMDYIKNSIRNNRVMNLFELDKIDWYKCHEFAINSLVETACELWNQGAKSTEEVGKILNLSPSTILNYLKQGSVLGWCDYDLEIARK